MINKFYTIGYEKSAVEDLIATLKLHDIMRLIDVRELPLSRKKGFSKNVLRTALEASGIEYVHLKGLGTPKEGRDAAKAGEHDRMKKIFSKHMKTETAQTDLKIAAKLVQKTKSCLFCYELSPHECHRTIVADAIAAKTSQEIDPIFVDKAAYFPFTLN